MMRILVFLAVLAIVSPAAYAFDSPVEPFVDYPGARAHKTWQYSDSEYEESITGDFEMHFPDGFVFVYQDDDGEHRLVSKGHITALHSPQRVEYEYELAQVFMVFDQVFLPLTRLVELEGDWLGEEALAGRLTHRFESSDEPSATYWFDAETGIPLRIIMEDGTDFLSTTSYQVHPEDEDLLASITLALHSTDWDGLLRLEYKDGHWFPRQIRVTDETAEIVLDYKDWAVLEDPGDFRMLERLNTSLEEGYAAYQAEEWTGAIESFREVLRIDPFYEPGYFYMAFSYGSLDNYLGAVENYQQWLMLRPENALALNNLAFTYMQQGLYLHDALALAEEALAIERRPAYLDTVGFGHYLLGRYETALDYLYEALETIDTHMRDDVLNHIILVYEALGDEEQADYYKGLRSAEEG